MPSRLRRTALGLAGATALLAAGAGPASAAVLTAPAADCTEPAVSQPFAPWLDYASYSAVPGGDFESGADGWTLSGGASVTGNGSTHFGGDSALRLPSGSSATSPSVCVDLAHPTTRFFVKRTSGGLLGVLNTLRVEAVFTDVGGTSRSVPAGVALGSSSWQPTLPLPILANVIGLGDQVEVAFRFTPVAGDWGIDDVYVDPFSRK